jgi:hypothetical protein
VADEIDPRELAALNGLLERGQNDEAFAVAYSNGVGVEGYVDAALLGIDEELLGSVVTTATSQVELDLFGQWDVGDSGLDPAFVVALAGPGDGFYEPPSPQDGTVLAEILSHADPPQDLGVAIANARLTPLLDGMEPESASDLAMLFATSDVYLANLEQANGYMAMLRNNRDTAAAWLADGGNLELALGAHGLHNTYGILGGPGGIAGYQLGNEFDQSVALLIGTGVTHPDPDVALPLINRSIDWTSEHAAELRADGGMANPYTDQVLAVGWATHIDLMVPEDMRIEADGTIVHVGGAGDMSQLGDSRPLADFFSVIMLHPVAAGAVYGQLALLNGERALEENPSAANMLGLANGAHRYGLKDAGISLTEAELQALADDQATFNIISSATGMIPYWGAIQSTGQIILSGMGWDPFGLAHPTELDEIRDAEDFAIHMGLWSNGAMRVAAVNRAVSSRDLGSAEEINEQASELAGGGYVVDLFEPGSDEQPQLKNPEDMTPQERVAFEAWLATDEVRAYAGLESQGDGGPRETYDLLNSAFGVGFQAADTHYNLGNDE